VDPRIQPVNDAEYYRIPLDLIDANPYQPRKFFDKEALRSLGESMRKIGQLEDILVRPVGDRYELVLGERRWRASKLVGMDSINAKVRALADAETFTISLAENVQRQDLTGVEEAFAFKRYLDEGLTQEEIGEHLGKLDRRIGEKLKLLSSSFYVKYLEKRLDEIEADLRQSQQENRILRGDRSDVNTCVRLVTEDDLVTHLEAGWDLVTPVSGNRFVVRRSNLSDETVP